MEFEPRWCVLVTSYESNTSGFPRRKSHDDAEHGIPAMTSKRGCGCATGQGRRIPVIVVWIALRRGAGAVAWICAGMPEEDLLRERSAPCCDTLPNTIETSHGMKVIFRIKLNA